VRRRIRELAGGLACVALVLLAYHSVVFGGKTFDASTTVPGVNGPRPPTGVAAPHVVDGIRVDRGAAPWQTTPAEPDPQANSEGARSASSKATSHDRHVRKHRAGNRHHRPRTTAKKSHNS